MTELDFLPDWYHVRRERRRGYFVLFWLLGCLIALMGVWFYLTHNQLGKVQAELKDLKAERAVVNDHLVKIDKLRSVRDDLIRKAAINAQLQNQPDALQVVGQIMELMPEDISLMDLQLSTEVVKAKAPPVRKGSKAPAAPKEPDKIHYLVQITGLAPYDVSVANFIARLSATEGFQNVQMGYAKDLLRNDRRMREFQVNCRLADDWKPVSADRWEHAQVVPLAGQASAPVSEGQ
ncbi:MAG: hypothetical protein BIFFINMI_01615 [Phycisphaerae bacterium]|nr:hypothetical protein [Phycisphaerae bacterium]